jgi:hypothetical protein
MSIKRAIATAAVLAALTLAGSAPAAPSATSLTGTWAGRTAQDLIDTDVQWSKPITVKALGGRLYSITAYVRVQCPVEGALGAMDMLLAESYGSKGPRLTKNGGFAVVIRGVSIRGVLGKGGASGRFDYARAGCEGKGSWQARRFN